ncbi:NAD-dependent epimerase/dehydratase [Magnetococcus marinus MC-1]|uniref:NAD-dependent epimerase/dehydratase n=1 Tax=Magnetococcus marinus (strain ATCC BAA-1437 / JCM 17883 / MC-1) TaxID=156889 RepID=A0LBM1_MAGMM|nr:NAD-dependent epimerase/dehydratase family protein [Magnetococcus marinus]ABK45364.1 NAD-dependent epimerase/dehydratase [Magnetococcus marinus MC-1]
MFRTLFIPGGAGFVGSNLAILFKQAYPDRHVVVMDNLKRRGSELTLPRLAEHGVTFLHGDVRVKEDVEAVGPFDLLIECSAEPSVHAGYGESPAYLLSTNLTGGLNCFEAARQHQAAVLFLSTSRIYPITPMRALPLKPMQTRLYLPQGVTGTGWSDQGIAEDFSLAGARSLYGASKLSCETVLMEYAEAYQLPALVYRCGVLAGPWQMGKVDQGFVTHWVSRHHYGTPLSYVGFGGEGLQVRDLLHIADLFELIHLHLPKLESGTCPIFNVGGGVDVSASLQEMTTICQNQTGKEIVIGRQPETRDADIPYYVSDTRKIKEILGWQPKRSVETIVADIHQWICSHEKQLSQIFL